MFPQRWSKPIYDLKAPTGKQVLIDVTTSVSPGLPANHVFLRQIIPFFKKYKVRSVLDFGAGSLRHTFPLLKAGFEVCIVEFPEGFNRPVCQKALANARTYPNFSALVWPKDFIRDNRRFDAALLIYVLQTMPIPRERERVLRHLYQKMNIPGFLFYCSRFNQISAATLNRPVSDGYYMWPKRHLHSFYREFRTADTHTMMHRRGFVRIRSLGERGTDQMFIYLKGMRFMGTFIFPWANKAK